MNHTLVAFDFHISLWFLQGSFSLEYRQIRPFYNQQAWCDPHKQWRGRIYPSQSMGERTPPLFATHQDKNICKFSYVESILCVEEKCERKVCGHFWIFRMNSLRCSLEQWMKFKFFLLYINQLLNETKWHGCNKENDSIYRILKAQ